MNEKELQQLVQKISIESFHKPFRHQATFNRRLRTTGGRYLLLSHSLEFNPRQLEYYGRESFVKIIKHELCHYHLHLSGRGFHHRDSAFRQLLEQVGGSRYCERIPGLENHSIIHYRYICSLCGMVYLRKRRLNTTRYVCGSCGGILHLDNSERE